MRAAHECEIVTPVMLRQQAGVDAGLMRPRGRGGGSPFHSTHPTAGGPAVHHLLLLPCVLRGARPVCPTLLPPCAVQTIMRSFLGVGAPEAILVAVVALVVFGPKGLADVSTQHSTAQHGTAQHSMTHH